MNWQKIALGDCFTIKHGFAFKSQHFAESGEYIVLTPGNFHESGGFRARPGRDRFYTIEPPDDFVLDPGDLVIAMTEQGEGLLGSSALIPKEGSYLHNQRIGLVENLDEDKLIKGFLYRLFNTPKVRGHIRATASGTKVRHTAPKRIYTIEVSIPPVTTQRKISDILSAYDDLIENNHRRIGLLVEGAHLLYREWFVSFRFPGHKHVKIIDNLPEGWERVKTRQVLTALESGSRPRGGALEGDGIPSIGAENVLGLGQYDYSKEKYITEDYFARMRRGIVQSRDVVLYKDGAYIGRSSMFGDGFPHSHCAVNEHVFILRAKADVGQSYLYFWLAQPETRRSIFNLNANTAQPGISQDKLKTLWFLRPPRVLRQQFNERVEAQVAEIFRLALMSQRLTQARDLLLPRLMNGEIAV